MGAGPKSHVFELLELILIWVGFLTLLVGLFLDDSDSKEESQKSINSSHSEFLNTTIRTTSSTVQKTFGIFNEECKMKFTTLWYNIDVKKKSHART